jgi:hypothetical protein
VDVVKNLFLIALLSTASLWAEALSLTIGPPIAASLAPGVQKTKSSGIFAARINGCADLTKAQLKATGEGMVAGERKTVSYEPMVIPASTPGVYTIGRQWGNEGTWVVAVTATCGPETTGAIVPTRLNEFLRNGLKLLPHAPTQAEIETALKALHPPQ